MWNVPWIGMGSGMRGGPRPNAGRPRRQEPTTAIEAAVELSRYADGVTAEGERVVLTLHASTTLINKLRRRKAGKEKA